MSDLDICLADADAPQFFLLHHHSNPFLPFLHLITIPKESTLSNKVIAQSSQSVVNCV